ncbi:MAG: hypothetical protein ACYTAF_09960 [Planctomycetota bacterium]|jgi:hypothetical protein
MGRFQRKGTFKDRQKFLAALKAKIGELCSGTLAGMSVLWTQEDQTEVGTLAGFGVQAKFTVRETDWECSTDLPVWLPVSQAQVEEMFDGAFKDLDNL